MVREVFSREREATVRAEWRRYRERKVLRIAALSATSVSERSWSNVLASWSRQCLASEVTNATLSNDIVASAMRATCAARLRKGGGKDCTNRRH